MSETKVASGVIGLTTFHNKLVLSSLHPEDVGKSERVIEDQLGNSAHEDLVALATGMLGLWSGKIDAEDGQDLKIAIPAAFSREFTEETRTESLPGIVLHPDQLQGQPSYAGRIEQIRPPMGRVLFWAYALPMIEFTWEQMNQLAARQKPGQELWELAIDQATTELQTHWQDIRPTSRLAIQALLAQDQQPTIWHVPLALKSNQVFGFKQAWSLLYTSFLCQIYELLAKNYDKKECYAH